MNRIGILTTDTDLVVTTWDSELERMSGIPADRARGRRLDEIVPDLRSRVLLDLIREPLISGSAQVLAPALHKFLIPCPPLEPSKEFEYMQQRVVVGALRDAHRAVGLVMSIEDVTERLERERELARKLRDGSPAARLAAVEQLTPLEPTDGVGPLGMAIADDDWRVRRAAVKALAARRDEALVDAVISALRDGHRNFSLLSSALQLLTLTGVDSTKALIRLLDDPDPDLRIQAALALGSQRQPESAAALLHALDDPDPNVRFHAVESLGRLASPLAIEKLAAIAESRDFYLAFPALEALVRINDPVIVPRIAPLLGDPMLGAAAAEALGQIGDEDAVGPLADALAQPAMPVAAVVEALVRIQHRYQTSTSDGEEIKELVRRRLPTETVGRVLESLERTSDESIRPLISFLGWLRDPAIPRALVRLLGAEEARHDVVEACVRFGSDAVPLLIEQLRADRDTRRAAVVALGRIGDRRAVEPLIGVLEERDRDLWLAAASALARLGDPSAFEPLLRLLGDGDVSIRQAAIGALNSIGHPDMGARICGMLDDANPLVRESAVKVAGYFGYAECADAMVARCADGDDGVRAASIEHLPFFDDSRTMEILASVLDRDTPRARAAAAKALGSVPAADAQPLLRRAARDADAWVRYFAASSLGRHGDPATLDILGTLAADDPAPHVRIAAVDAIGGMSGERALAILTPLIAEDSDVGLAAIRASGSVRSEDAIAALGEALRSRDAARRTAAAGAIAAYSSANAIELLQWTASSDEDPVVVQAALNGLRTIANKDTAASSTAVAALVALLSDPSRRSAAIDVASRLAPSAIPVLAESLAKDDPPTRRGVVEALGRLSHSVASSYLQRALSDGDDAVRREAVRALSRLGTRGLTSRFAAMSETDFSPAVRQAAAAALSRQGVQEAGE